MRTCCASALYAASRFGFSSSKGTSTVSLTRVGLSASLVAFTTGASPVLMRARAMRADGVLLMDRNDVRLNDEDRNDDARGWKSPAGGRAGPVGAGRLELPISCSQSRR